MTTSAFARALRAKYGSDRKAVLRKLGIDEAVLSAPPPPSSSNGGDRLTAMRVEIEQLLSELDLDEKQVSRILEMLNKHAPFDRVDDDDPNAERARELAGDDEENERRFCEFLRQHGLSDNEDIKRALDIVHGAADYSNGKPENVFKGGLRGGQIAGDADIARLVSRITIEPNFDDRRTSQVVVGMDSAAVDQLNKMFPGIERIGHW
jgi:hypothetical protein